jgi:hypothetical protein
MKEPNDDLLWSIDGWMESKGQWCVFVYWNAKGCVENLSPVFLQAMLSRPAIRSLVNFEIVGLRLINIRPPLEVAEY